MATCKTTQHSGAPWTIKRDTGRMPCVIRSADGHTIAGVYWNELMDDPDAECTGNANVMHAAPELLAALRDATDTLEMLYHPKDAHRRADKAELLERARGAIAKAEGR